MISAAEPGARPGAVHPPTPRGRGGQERGESQSSACADGKRRNPKPGSARRAGAAWDGAAPTLRVTTARTQRSRRTRGKGGLPPRRAPRPKGQGQGVRPGRQAEQPWALHGRGCRCAPWARETRVGGGGEAACTPATRRLAPGSLRGEPQGLVGEPGEAWGHKAARPGPLDFCNTATNTQVAIFQKQRHRF